MSWSGEQSRAFAEILKPWLEVVLPGTEVWLSCEDIDKGTIWFTEIVGQLETCACGILCITRQNHLSPWIHFEAGGMVKGLGKGKVAAILLDMDYHELHQPLSFFNGLRLNREGVWQLVKSFAREFNRDSKSPIKDPVIERTFGKFWPELDEDYLTLFPEAHRRSQEAEPVNIVTPKPPEPSLLAVSNQAKTGKGKKSSRSEAESHQPRLFNA